MKCRFSIQRFIFLLIFCQETPQERLRSNKPLIRTVPCELVGDFISSHSGLSRNPIEPHSVPGRDMAQRLLALPYETWPIGSSEGTRVFTEVQRKCSKFKPSEMYAVSTGKQFPTFRRKTVLLFSRCSGRPLGPD